MHKYNGLYLGKRVSRIVLYMSWCTEQIISEYFKLNLKVEKSGWECTLVLPTFYPNQKLFYSSLSFRDRKCIIFSFYTYFYTVGLKRNNVILNLTILIL